MLAARDKYIDLPIPEVYDLVSDSAEANNLHAAAANRAQMLRHTLEHDAGDDPDALSRSAMLTR